MSNSRSILRRVPVIVSLAALVATTISGQFLVVCRAPGGHFGTKILILAPSSGQDDCCDCMTCHLPDPAAGAGQPASIGLDPCSQPCNDTALAQPFTHAASRADDVRPMASPSVASVEMPVSTLVHAAPGVETPIAPPLLELLRTSILQI